MVPKEEEVDMTTPWRGKPSNFFVMETAKEIPETPDAANPNNLEMNDDQWAFIFKHYPEYGAAPHAMMTWLFGQALQNEEMYAKPMNSGQEVENEGEEEKTSSKYDGIGAKGNK